MNVHELVVLEEQGEVLLTGLITLDVSLASALMTLIGITVVCLWGATLNFFE